MVSMKLSAFALFALKALSVVAQVRHASMPANWEYPTDDVYRLPRSSRKLTTLPCSNLPD